MNDKNHIDEKTQKILRGLEVSYRRLVKFKLYKNSPLIISKNGVILEVSPEDIKPETEYVAHD